MRPKIGTPSTRLGGARGGTGLAPGENPPDDLIFRSSQRGPFHLSPSCRFRVAFESYFLHNTHFFSSHCFVVTCRHLSSPVSSPVVTCRHLSSPVVTRLVSAHRSVLGYDLSDRSIVDRAPRAPHRDSTRPPSPTDSSSLSGLGRPHRKGVAFSR